MDAGAPHLPADPRGRRYDAAFVAVLALLIAACFRSVVFGGRVFFYRDFGLFFYPRRLLSVDAARNLTVPLWESLSAGGQPVLGALQHAFFYPPALLYYLLPLPQSLMLFTVAHFLVAGFGMYYMLRVWGAGRVGAAVAGLVWAFSPPLVSIIDNLSFMTSLAWLPWCVAFEKRLLDSPSRGAFAGLAVTFALMILAGAPEPVLFALVFLTALPAGRIIAAWRRGSLRVDARRAALAAAAIALAMLISGVELAPFLYLLANSRRGEGLGPKTAGLWSLALRDVPVWVLPRFGLQFTRGGTSVVQQQWLKSVYLGAAIPFLAAWVLAAGRRRRTVLFAVMGVFFLALAFGSSSPLWAFLYRTLPGFSMIRYPVKFFLPAAFAAVALAGLAVDDMLEMPRHKLRRVFFLAAALAAVAVLFLAAAKAADAWPEFFRSRVFLGLPVAAGADSAALAEARFVMTRWSFTHSAMMLLVAAVGVWAVAVTRHRAAALLVGATVAAELILFAPSLTPITGPLIYTTPAVRAASADRSPGAPRVYHTQAFEDFINIAPLSALSGVDGLYAHMAAVKGPNWASSDRFLAWASQAAGRRLGTVEELDAFLEDPNAQALLAATGLYEYSKEVFRANTHLLSGVPVVEGFDAVEVRWSANLWQYLRLREDDGPARIGALFAAGTVVDYAESPPHFSIRPADGPPRAFLTRSVVRAAGDREAFPLVADASFDPRRAVVLIGPDADDAVRALASSPPPSADAAFPSIAPPGTVRWLSDTGNRQRLAVSSPSPSLLYVADAWYPALRARVNGEPTPIYRANYAFRAVPVPAGASTVEVYYLPLDLYAGLAASALGLAGLALALLLLRRSKRTRQA